MRKIYILCVLIVFFTGFAFSVVRMENLRANGTPALLPLAPVDPRALLMGDYMVLEYLMNRAVLADWKKTSEEPRSGGGRRGWAWAGPTASGKAVLRLTHAGTETGTPPVAQFVRLDDGTPLGEDEVLIAFKVRGSRVVTAAPAFYFEEGSGKYYQSAGFGRVTLGRDGKTLLLALCDGKGRDIRPERRPE